MMEILKSATSVREASDAVLLNYEKPADQSDTVKERRASFGQIFYDKYTEKPKFPYKVKVNASNLTIRKGAGISNVAVGKIIDRGVYTITAEEKIGESTWGRLMSGAGWINVGKSYVSKV